MKLLENITIELGDCVPCILSVSFSKRLFYQPFYILNKNKRLQTNADKNIHLG